MSKTPIHYKGSVEGCDCETALCSMLGRIRSKNEPERACVSLVQRNPMAVVWWAMAFKYLWRWPFKGGISDLEKAVDCVGRIIDLAVDSD